MEATILQVLAENSGKGTLTLKKLRKQCTQDDLDSEESHKKAIVSFKLCFEALLKSGKVIESVDGSVCLKGETAEAPAREDNETKGEKLGNKKDKKDKKEKKEKKRKDRDEDSSSSSSSSKQKISKVDQYDLAKNGEQAWRENSLPPEYLENNPDQITRLFCGNLKLDVTEDALKECLTGITYIRWQKDKTTKNFYGSTFLEMKDPRAAALAVAKDRTKFMGRPLKIYYCPPREGVQWPPAPEHDRGNFNNLAADYDNSGKDTAARGSSDGGDGMGGPVDPKTMGRGYSQRPKTPKPPGCKKLYAGNLAYSIDDDTIVDFFKECGEMVGLRWLTNRDSGEFRGCGFVEFSNSEEADKAMQLDGTELLGRPIRLDWTL